MTIRLIPEYFPEENVKVIKKFVEVCKDKGVEHFLVYDCEGNFEGAAKGLLKLLDHLDGLDDIVEVVCSKSDESHKIFGPTLGTFYFNMGNEEMEIFHDYSDNEFCNQVYNQVEKEIEQNGKKLCEH